MLTEFAAVRLYERQDLSNKKIWRRQIWYTDFCVPYAYQVNFEIWLPRLLITQIDSLLLLTVALVTRCSICWPGCDLNSRRNPDTGLD